MNCNPGIRLVLSCALALAFAGVAGTSRGVAAPELDASLATAHNPMTVVLDERMAPRGIALTHMTIPVKPGEFTLDYPQWIPGEHGPTGPLHDMSELVIKANGKPLDWHRDQVDMYAFHVDVPQGVTSLDVDFTALLNTQNSFIDGQLATRNIMVGNWNRYILYQQNIDNHQYYVKASMILPPGWDYASSLPVASRNGQRVNFKPVTLAMLVDSPTDSGRFYKHVLSYDKNGLKIWLDMFADNPEDLDVPAARLKAYEHFPAEEMALYGGHHFDVYHSELTLSDLIPPQGIEHHQSSDDRADDAFMTSEDEQLIGGDLLTHEMSHSWNGKYRRPFDLAQPDFNWPHPEHTELLWQYEGMNQYMGDLVAFRSGIKGTAKDYPEYLAMIYAQMAYEPGRNTEPIIDTTTAAPYLYGADGDYPNIRRTAGDFYTEGELMWLDADTIIRQLTHEKKSLDTYCHIFAGGDSGPALDVYNRAQIEHYLSEVVPYNWHGFFQRYVYSIAPQPPTGEIRRAGYRLVFNDKPNKYIQAGEVVEKGVDSWFDIGVNIGDDGKIGDVRENSPAWNADLAPGETIMAVNGRAFTPDVWHAAVKATSSRTSPLTMLVDHDGTYEEHTINYTGGARYPHLVRIPGTYDMLTAIMQPHAK